MDFSHGLGMGVLGTGITIIGFFIYIEYFDKIVRKALSGQNPDAEPEV